VVEQRETAVVDASMLVDMLAGTERASAANARLRRVVVHAPVHIDAEVLSALGRMYRAGDLSVREVDAALARLSTMPLNRHPLPDLLAGAWARRDDLRLADALYVELAAGLKMTVLTTDLRLARACPFAETIGGD
jgi:predicted nucleic acid-binding protein